MVVVMTPGPPPVKTYIISKVLKASIARNKITVISIGLIKGMEIYLNICGLEAPSTMAASRGSEGIAVSPLSPKSVIYTLILIDVIEWTPFTFLLLYAAMRSLPSDFLSHGFQGPKSCLPTDHS